MTRHRFQPALGFLAAVVGSGLGLLRVAAAAAVWTPHPRSAEAHALIVVFWLAAGLWAWLVASTFTSAARRIVPSLRGVRSLDCATLPAVRRWLDRVAVATLVSTSVLPAAAAHAHASPSTAATVWVRGASKPTPTPTPTLTSAPTSTPPEAPTAPTATASEPPFVRGSTKSAAARPTPGAHVAEATPLARHVVRPGDNLWLIARHEMHRRNPSATNAEVATYWAKVIRENRPRLRSGNPSLIFPGEVIALPA